MADALSHTPRVGGRHAALARLKAHIRALDGVAGGRTVPVGLPALDQALPGGGLALGALHEILRPAAEDGAADGFAAVLLACLARAAEAPVLWIAGDDDLYPPGLAGFGLTPERLILARAQRRADRLWAAEEAARAAEGGAALAAVLAEVPQLDLVASRRLHLAAEAGGAALLLLRPAAGAGTSVAVTRWTVDAMPGAPDVLAPGIAEPGVGRPRWRLELLRCRGGRPGSWTVDWLGGEAGLALAGDRHFAVPDDRPAVRGVVAAAA